MSPSLSSDAVFSSALRSMLLAMSAFGAVDSVQLTTAPSKQSTIGLRRTLPAGIENCVTSVSCCSPSTTCWYMRSSPRSRRRFPTGRSRCSRGSVRLGALRGAGRAIGRATEAPLCHCGFRLRAFARFSGTGRAGGAQLETGFLITLFVKTRNKDALWLLSGRARHSLPLSGSRFFATVVSEVTKGRTRCHLLCRPRHCLLYEISRIISRDAQTHFAAASRRYPRIPASSRMSRTVP